MMTLLEIIVFGLATWRVSSLFVKEYGPFFVFSEIRMVSGIYTEWNLTNKNPNEPSSLEQKLVVPPTFFAELLSCVWCFSMYAGLFWTFFHIFFPAIAFYCALPFAYSALTILIDRFVKKE